MEQHDYAIQLAEKLNFKPQQVSGVLDLLGNGGTVPFIARYRKEMTGSLDEVAITTIRDEHQKLIELDKRKQAILTSVENSGHLSEALRKKLENAPNLSVLEDLYLPYRPKRKTRATKARELGLEPLAHQILKNKSKDIDLQSFLSDEVDSIESALQGARDIIAEMIAEDVETRAYLRNLFTNQAVVSSTLVKKQEDKGQKYKDYFDWQEPVTKAAGHRLLAMFRGEMEKILKLSIRPNQETAFKIVKRQHVAAGPWQQQLIAAAEDSYTRLLAPSLETELAGTLKKRADHEAIEVFGDNLRQLLLSPPLGAKRVLAIDPGFRTGGKVVCLDSQGTLLENTTIYPTLGRKQQEEAARVIRELVTKYNIEAIAIGNGTAGRETESFVRELKLQPPPVITLVNEDGASIYSASETARQEFPDLDITVRGAVSIGRRLQDPLAELVKIDPKSIGVGQYQHDVNQTELKQRLKEVVESCVNSVGVELNSASVELLTFVAGLGRNLAENIISFRSEITSFDSRRQLLKVPRLGLKAFEQCAGFLRITGGSNPLDASAVHPESYKLVDRMAKDGGVTVSELMQRPDIRKKLNPGDYTSSDVGPATIKDILAELDRPGRDPRREFEHFQFDGSVHTMDDLHEGMQLPAIITNITKFGAFADIGIKENGLIHISQMADRYVKDPAEVVTLGQKLMVRVLEIDKKRNRIALSLKTTA